MANKTFPVRLEVEEIALGTVLRKLNEMPGIAKLELDLDRGGEGAGRKRLEDAVANQASHGRGNHQQTIARLLMSGPKHIGEISRAIGGNKSSAYTATSMMRKQGLIESGVGKGVHQLTAAAMAQLGSVQGKAPPAMPALPAPVAPDEIKRTPSGRAAVGSGAVMLRAALAAGPVSGSSLRDHLVSKGLSAKAVDGLLRRTRVSGLVKKNGSQLFELTAKGQKIEMPGVAVNG